jgi:signal transduction histidine kinase/CheY-like chemotaxis protein
MLGTPTLDTSQSALEFVHRLLSVPAIEQASLDGLLDDLTAAFGATRAGLATFPEVIPLSIRPASAESLSKFSPPWPEQPDLLERLSRTHIALTMPRIIGGSCLLAVLGTPERGCWLLWLEDANRPLWSPSEGALLILVGQGIVHVLSRDETLAPWAVQLDRGIRRQRMDSASRIVRRLAHDFGNVLTGILGFSELALSQQVAPNSPLHAYLTEVHRGAQNGAQYTNQLRLFARRQTTSNRTCNLSGVLAEEEKRLQPLLSATVQLRFNLPDDLPAVAVEHEPLRQALAIVLDNAREAITGSGIIDVSARTVGVSAWQAREFIGDVRPGKHLEIRVSDSGSGLTPEAQRQLFAEPFFSTKPRKRGFGLAMAYGILSTHYGGLELLRRPEGGTVARLIVPAAELAAPPAPRAPASSRVNPLAENRASIGTSPHERILIVDDDPMILQFTATTLERAGFRTQTAANAEEAWNRYNNAATDPFKLILTDVLMPDTNGIELAHRLIAKDASVPILFMSGQVPTEIVQQHFGSGRFDLVSKPFRPDGLVRAVRAVIERTRGIRGTENRMRKEL